MTDLPTSKDNTETGSDKNASGSFMVTLCGCLALVACGGVTALCLAFDLFLLSENALEGTLLAGLCVMGASLIALPGVLAGEKKSTTFLATCGICTAISFASCLSLQSGAPLILAGLGVYGVALGSAVFFVKKNGVPWERARHLSPLTAWALVPALAFGLMATGMMHETTVSQRLLLAGKTTGCFTAILCFLAFFGVLRPKFYTNIIYASLFFIWLLVPVTGLEAYMYTEGVSLYSAYAASDWKWSFLFCGVAFAGTMRMIFLRHDLLPAKSWLAELFT